MRDDIAELFNGENYAELARFVQIVVLPHNEEGVLDTRAEIDEWLRKKAAEAKKKADEAAKKRARDDKT